MRDPDTFKYDVRVRERMLRAGRVNTDDIARLLDALPDLEANLDIVTLNQPALDAAAAGAGAVVASATRQSVPPSPPLEDASDDDPDDGDNA
jgi:hypothetical protein